jgi:hypothetical protein
MFADPMTEQRRVMQVDLRCGQCLAHPIASRI